MHASAAFVLAVAGFATAQSTSSVLPVSGCGNSIDLIIQSCLGTTQAQYNACTPNDWGCLCEQANNVLTCYNNCPSAPQRFGFEQTKVANCNAASAYPSSSSTFAATMTATMSRVSATATTTPSSTTDTETSQSGTRTGTSATATPSTLGSGAASVAVPAGLAAIFGLLAFL